MSFRFASFVFSFEMDLRHNIMALLGISHDTILRYTIKNTLCIFVERLCRSIYQNDQYYLNPFSIQKLSIIFLK